jgi:hypothetical protein
MSRRFGRNQRRRARERIATLEQAIVMDRGLLAHVSERKRQLEQEISDAKRIVGRMSVLFEPESRRLDGPARSPMHLFTHSATMDDGRAFFHNQSKTVPLPVMLSRVNRDGLDMAIHCKVLFGDGQWGYAISEEAVLATPEDVLVERIARELAMTIGHQLAEVKPGRDLRR